MLDVRVGLLISQHELTAAEALDQARAADVAGLDVWVAGHLLALSRQREKATLEPLTLLGAIAVVTQRARLGWMVYPAPYVPSFLLAKAVVTLDHLSAGRLEIGLGAGWMEEELRAVQWPVPSGRERRAHLERTVDAIEAIADGAAWDYGDGQLVSSEPAAVQRPHPPLWLAGQGPRVLELVGRRADWANFARGISLDEFKDAAATIRRASRAAGRDEHAVRLSLTGAFLGAADADEFARTLEGHAGGRMDPSAYRDQLRSTNTFVGAPADMAVQMQPYIDAGCEAFVLWSLERHDPGVAVILAAVRAALRG